MAFVVLYDACVLYPAPIRDLLIRIANTGIVRVRWSERILDECFRNIGNDRPDPPPAVLERTRRLMCDAVPDCFVVGYEHLEAGLDLPDPGDRHVLAAAIRANAQAIVTFNLRDFPDYVLARYDIEAKHPDEFVLDSVDLARAVERGTIPSIYFSDDPAADLQAYAGTYLQQEVVAEGATRNIPAFSRFLRVAALCNGSIVNFTNVANDAQVARTTVYEYYEILKDTLVLRELPAWRQSARRKPIASSKYYFFDVGVAATLQGRAIRSGTPEFGGGLEAYLMHELAAHADYRAGDEIRYWRSTSGFEVDFIIGDHTAVEVKATATVSDDHLKGLRALAEEKKLKRYLCVSLVDRRCSAGGVTVLPWRAFLDELWPGVYGG